MLHEFRTISQDISRAFKTVWYPVLHSKLYAMASKANSTHISLTSSTLIANKWLSMESFHILSLSRLESIKAVFYVPSYFQSSSMIHFTLENPLYLFDDDSTFCHDIPHPSDRQVAASSLTSDLDKSQTGQTLGICLNPEKSLSFSL